MSNEYCFHLGEKEKEDGTTEFWVYTLDHGDQPVTPVFDDIGELTKHLVENGTSQKYDQRWIGAAAKLLKEHKQIPVQIGFAKPRDLEYIERFEEWKEQGGECIT